MLCTGKDEMNAGGVGWGGVGRGIGEQIHSSLKEKPYSFFNLAEYII